MTEPHAPYGATEPESDAPIETVEDTDGAIEEPATAPRSTPYAIAAFVVALVGIAPVGTSGTFGFFPLFLPGFPVDARVVASMLLSAVLPIGTAIIALWLASRAEKDVVRANGTLGGVGFFKAARVIAYLSLTVLVITVASHLLLRQEEERFDDLNYGNTLEDGDVVFGSPPPGITFPPDFPGPPAPDAPARPAFPAP